MENDLEISKFKNQYLTFPASPGTPPDVWMALSPVANSFIFEHLENITTWLSLRHFKLKMLKT